MKVTIACDGINCDNSFTLDAPDGWTSRVENADYGGDSSYTFCPECKKQAEWFDAQCPGCVAGFPDCGLSRSFDHSDDRTITAEHLNQIERGICPFRVNGSFMFSRETGFRQINLSDQAATDAGLAVANAIREYCKKYYPGWERDKYGRK